MKAPIEKIRISSLFWDDVADWRRSGDYLEVRRNLADLVRKGVMGLPMGDLPFSGAKDLWRGINHVRINGLLTLFTVRPAEGEIMLVALKKHAFYGFRNERKTQRFNAVVKLWNAVENGHAPSPDWPSVRWSSPSDLVGHPELREVSKEGLERLKSALMQETIDLAKFEAASKTLSGDEKYALVDRWVDDLVTAIDQVDDILEQKVRYPEPAYAGPDVFAAWESENTMSL